MFRSAALSGWETLKWKYIVGLIAAVIVLALVAWCICKRRMKGRNPFWTQRFYVITKSDSNSIILLLITNKPPQLKQ